jgi:hypothetical protein
MLRNSADIGIEIVQPEITVTGPDTATAVFTQNYRSAQYRDRVRKTLTWRKLGERWQIVGEATEKVAR